MCKWLYLTALAVTIFGQEAAMAGGEAARAICPYRSPARGRGG